MALCVSCSDDEPPPEPEPNPCLSGEQWELGLLGSPEMQPGLPCLDCHDPSHTDTFTAAGTVYDAFDEPDGCYGVGRVTVEVEDATGKVATATTNAAGNFFFEGEVFELPIIARVIRDGEIRTMPRFVFGTNCNDCHSQEGKLGAPGRVRAP
jgi:hypothetical protein